DGPCAVVDQVELQSGHVVGGIDETEPAVQYADVDGVLETPHVVECLTQHPCLGDVRLTRILGPLIGVIVVGERSLYGTPLRERSCCAGEVKLPTKPLLM